MKVHVKAENLQKKLSFVNHAISSKSQLPVLQNILLQTVDGHMQISSTDLEIGIQVRIPVEIEEEGIVTVPARTFTELVTSLPAESITLESQGTVLSVQSKRTKSSFQTIPAEEFPKLFEEKGDKWAVLDPVSLKKEFSSVVFAASADSARPALSGILVKREKAGDAPETAQSGSLLLVATDGYRLSLRHCLTKEMSNTPSAVTTESVIIPGRIFKELLSLKDEEGEIITYLSQESNQIVFECNDTLLIGRLIEATYPNYEKIIPVDFSAQITFDREEMLKAVKICSIFARDSANIIKFSLHKEKIVVSSSASAVGGNSVDVEAALSGEENEIAFNARYLLDMLANVDAEEFVLEMTGPLNPGVFRIKDNAAFLHLIMPIRVQA